MSKQYLGGGGLSGVYGEPVAEPDRGDLPRDLSTVTETAESDQDYVGRAEAPAHQNYGPWWEKLKSHRSGIKKPRHLAEFDELLEWCAKSDDPDKKALRGICVRQLREFYANYLHNEQANLESAISVLPEDVRK